jgi:hypothetical protein
MMHPGVTPKQSLQLWAVALCILIVIETLLLIAALVPAQEWIRIFPSSATATLDGPFPPVIAPVITTLLYVVPTAIGWLCQRWQNALLYATLPAWISLGLFLVAATFRIGIFYLVASDHVNANVATLELFGVLGGIGWLGRNIYKLR